MLMTVRAATRDTPGVVECETPLGTITGYWHGEVAPEVGQTEDVELDTVGGLTWSVGPSIVSDDGTSRHDQVLNGHVEDVDGVLVTVRVGPALLSLEVSGDPPLGVLGHTVAVRPAAFALWPTGV